MANPMNILRDSFRGEYQERKYKDWVTTVREAGGGSQKRRSTSAPAEERGHYPNLQFILSECKKGLNSDPPKTSRREKAQTAFSTGLRRCPHERSELSINGPPKKDVDGCQPNMRNTSDSGRKRKHKHSSDLNSHIISEDISSPESVKEIHGLPSNTEYEGVATSSKRIKLNAPETGKQDRRGTSETVSHAEVGPVDDSGDFSNALRLDRNLTSGNIDGEAYEQKTFSAKGNAAKKRPTSSEILARYRGSANNLPDYGPPVIPRAVALMPGRKTMAAGERKTVGVAGQFRPVNSLQRKESSSSPLPRPQQKKAFNIVQDSLNTEPDESRAAKRQKYGTRDMTRRDPSGSVIDLSGDGVQVGAMRSLSSTSSTPRKIVQSVGSRSHHHNQASTITLGNVDEYKRTEAMVGFNKKRRKALFAEEKRGDSFWEELDHGSRPHLVTLKPNPLLLSSNERYSISVNSGAKPILIDDSAKEEVVEVSQLPVKSSSATRDGTPRAEENNISLTEGKSRYFFNRDMPGATRVGSPDNEVTGESPQLAVETSRTLRGSSEGLQGNGNTVDDVEFLEEDDSIDLLGSDVNPASEEQRGEKKAGSSNHSMRTSTVPRSLSISKNGDIPGSALSRLRISRNQTRLTRESDLSFDINYMRSGNECLEIKADCVPWKLQYDHDKKELAIAAYDEPFRSKPGLVLKPEKIHVVKYRHDCAKVVISRATEASIGSKPQVLVQMSRPDDGGRLAQSLKRMNHTIKLAVTQREALDKIFAMAAKSATISNQNPQDMALLEVKEARLATQREKARGAATDTGKISVEVPSQTANIGRRRSSTAEQEHPTQTRRQTIARSALINSLSEASSSGRGSRVELPENEPSSSRRLSIVKAKEFYGSRPATRAFAGQWNGERQLRLPKSRSPSPTRWTREHPHWQEELSWERSLLFPKEGKKRVPVDPQDIERLDEGEFLNDNLIAFYLRYLEYRLEESQPELARRIYFHNTFFYETLTKGKIRSNNINYDAVKRWTSKVDLFSYDYIVVPVCEKLHWYVAIICNAPRLLNTNSPEIQENGQQPIPTLNTLPFTSLEDGESDSKVSEIVDNTPEAAEHISASPSVTAQVEHMSLEDQDWPEPDAVPDRLQPGTARLQDLQTTKNHFEGSAAKDGSEDQVQAEDIRPKVKKTKRKSMQPTRKYDPDDPRIITLDSLGGTHSPTCSNLREYLVCEAKSRHNVDINPGRLGMTAKGLPQQSNFCDCGIFVLGYIKKFLEDPDMFVYHILQGEMDERIDWTEMQAPKMRENIRNLIFQVHTEQTHDERELRGTKSRAKKASYISYLEAQTSQVSKLPNSEPQFTSNTSSRPIKLNAKDVSRARTPETKNPSSEIAEDQGNSSMREVEPQSIERARRSTPFPESFTTRVNMDEDSEIMETPDPILAARGALGERGHLRSPMQSTNSLIQLDSPLDPSSRDKWLKSPNSKVAEGSKTHNPFKEFARVSTSPFQNTRRKSRHNGTFEQQRLEIKDPQEDRRLEVRETPPRQIEREGSFEDILELPSELRPSKIFDLEDNEAKSSSRVQRRKSGGHR